MAAFRPFGPFLWRVAETASNKVISSKFCAADRVQVKILVHLPRGLPKLVCKLRAERYSGQRPMPRQSK
jgi:hypothetical protein